MPTTRVDGKLVAGWVLDNKTVQTAYLDSRLVYQNKFYLTIASNQNKLALHSYALQAGWNGSQQLIVTVNAGVIIYSDNVNVPGLDFAGSYPYGLTLYNYGGVTGAGGYGGDGQDNRNDLSVGQNGGPAISLGSDITIYNYGYFAGGGGGGGGGQQSYDSGGSGGPGGGGQGFNNPPPGEVVWDGDFRYIGGWGSSGSGGVGGVAEHGGYSGGVAGANGSAGSDGTSNSSGKVYGGGAGGGGGGGWGAPGGWGGSTPYYGEGRAGGYGAPAIVPNGHTITWGNVGTIYGSTAGAYSASGAAPIVYPVPTSSGSSTGHCCLISGTLIKTPFGDTPVEVMVHGYAVTSFDLVKMQYVTTRVKRRIEVERDCHYLITSDRGTVIGATDDHPFFDPKDGVWKSIDPLASAEPYDNLVSATLTIGSHLKMFENSDDIVVEIVKVPGTIKTYTLELDSISTFFANGTLTHNSNNC